MAAGQVRSYHVGVTGHRPNRLPESEAMRVKGQVRTLLEQIAARVTPRTPVLVSGLAEGADRLVAHAALELGWALAAILPFETDIYERDFATAASRREYQELLAAAGSIDPVREVYATVDESYAAQGRRLVERCDELLCIWDGEASAGLGGTLDVVIAALRKPISVHWIHASKQQRVRKLGIGDVQGV
jgi:hypothetical protein